MVDPPIFAAAYNAGQLTRPTVFMQALQNHTRRTLRKYPINIGDDGTLGNSGITNRCFVTNGNAGFRPGKILRTKRLHAAESFNFNLTNLGLPVGHQISVYRVAAVVSNVAPSWCVLPRVGGPNIMVTVQLTGCAVMVANGPNPGDIKVAHLQPNAQNHQTGLQLYNHLLGQNYLAVYGRGRYDHRDDNGLEDRRVAIIGVRRNGRWKIYAQKKGTVNNDIRSVHRIYPA